MAHIHTNPGEYDHTVSAFIIRTDFDEPRLMLHKHKKLGVYLQFGGHIETNENPWEAISHELLEETGYEMSQLHILQPHERLKALEHDQVVLHPVPVCHNSHAFDASGTHYHSDTAYAFITNEEPKHPLGTDESSDVRFVSKDELIAMSGAETYANIVTIGSFVFDICLTSWEAVETAEFNSKK